MAIYLSFCSFVKTLCIALMIFSAISFVAFLAILAASSPVFISFLAIVAARRPLPASICLPLNVERGHESKRMQTRVASLEYPEKLCGPICIAFVPVGHFWQRLQEQGSGCSPERQGLFSYLLRPHLNLRLHFLLGLTKATSFGSSSSSQSPLPLPLPL